MKVWALVLAATMVFAAGFDAEAARLGGGRSIGRQSSNVTQRQAAPAPVAPTQNATNAVRPAPAVAPAAAPAVAAKRPWGAMLGGLAAGVGLAWLAHSMGLGAEMGQFLMIGLVVLAGMLLWGFIRSRKAVSSASQDSPFAFQGAAAPSAVPTYLPENVGNDASARPFERSSHMAPLDVGGSMIGSALAGPQGWGAPAGFDSEGFLRAAKNNFITLQSAWDRSDISSLRAMMTDTMLGEIQAQLTDRETHTGGNTNKTDVVMLDAQLLGIEDLGNDYMASVEFSGMIREQPSAGPSPFREVWNMTKPKSGASGWLVAGVQALQ